MKAFLFINVDGEAPRIATALRALPGVVEADAVTGDIDIIAGCEANDLLDLNRVLDSVKLREGVIHATTTVVISPPAESATIAAAA